VLVKENDKQSLTDNMPKREIIPLCRIEALAVMERKSRFDSQACKLIDGIKKRASARGASYYAGSEFC
jgi:hypothetical protein